MARTANTYYTKLTILMNCPIKDGYYIDNINDFFYTYPSNNKQEFSRGLFVNHTKSEILEYNINADLDDFINLQHANYAKIDYFDPDNNQKYLTLYFFVKHVEFVGSSEINGVAKFYLVTDILNSYRDYNFSPKTFIIKQHQDRWNASTLMLKNGFYQCLKNIYLDDSVNVDYLHFLNSANIYPENSQNIQRENYWVKIIYKANDGLYAFFCNFNRDFSVYVKTGEGGTQILKEVKSFLKLQEKSENLNYDHLTVLLNNVNVLSVNLLPYPPASDFVNLTNQMRLLKDSPFSIYNLVINSQAQDYSYNFLSISLNKNIGHLSDEININIMDNNETINSILIKLLSLSIRPEDLIRLKSERVPDGYFQLNRYSFDLNGFYHLNEPSLLSSKLLNLSISFNGLDFLIIPENIKYIQNYPPLLDSNLLNFSISQTKGIKNSLILKIKNTNNFHYINNVNFMGYLVEYRFPQFSNSYYDYDNREKIQSIKNEQERIEKIKEIRNEHGVFDKKGFINQAWDAFQGMVKTGATYATYGIKEAYNYLTNSSTAGKVIRGAASFIFGRPMGVVSAAASFLFDQEKQNALNIVNVGDYETLLLTDSEYKLKFIIKQSKNLDLYRNLFYLQGNTYNRCDIPTHNSRKYFDFLQCEPVFFAMNYEADIANKIIEYYRNGVTFIHNNANKWVFPEEYAENIEISLINAI